jgi:hypothetical protein
MTTIVSISDTHCLHDQISVPHGDILIHAGDALNSGSIADNNIKPRTHIFGHIHFCHGQYYDSVTKTQFVNAAICNEQYDPINQPIGITL